MSHTRPPKAPAARQLPPPTPLSLATGALVLLMLLTSLVRFSIDVYALPAALSPVLGMCLLGGVVSIGIWSLPRFREPTVVLLLVVVGVIVTCNQAQFLYGAQGSWEALTAFWQSNTTFTGQYVLANPLPAPQHQAAVQLFLGTTFALLALPLGWAILRRRTFWLSFALTLPWLMPAFLAEVDLNWPAVLVICACWASLLLSTLTAQGNPKGSARILLLSLPISFVALWVFVLLFPPQHYTQPSWAAHLRTEWNHLEWLPWERQGEGTPDGGLSVQPGDGYAADLPFSSAGPREYTGRSILRVSTTQPGPIYLRGEVYQDYTSQAWTGVEPESMENLPLEGDDPLSATASATISYVTSPRSTIYLPYQSVLVEDRQVFPDSPLVFPQARQEYTVAYTPLEEDPSTQIMISFDQGKNDAYENYLDVPEEISDDLLVWFTQAMEELEQSGEPVNATASGVYASQLNTASIIAQLLSRNAQYDLLTPRTPSEEDFVTYFLEQSHRGYCVHFATAATLLLRTQGIPARYVSGYATSISPIITQSVTQYTTLMLDSNAHAWVEIYLDGYGWYPVEVTPSSPGSYLPNLNTPHASSAPSSPVTTPKPTPTPQPTPTPTVPSQDQASGMGGSGLWLVWTVPMAVLTLGLALLRLLRARRWKTMLRSSDTNAAVLWAYRWFGQLERWGGQAGSETEALARKARFSAHTLTSQERSVVMRQFQEEVARLKQASPIWKRWLLGLLFPVGSA